MLDYFSRTRSIASITTTTSRSACCTPSPRISCCRSRTTKWCTARARCSARCRATSGSASPTRARFSAYMWAHPGKKLLFMGRRSGSTQEWNHDARVPLGCCCSSTTTASCRRLVRELNRLYRAQPGAVRSGFPSLRGFEWVDFHDVENSIIAFLRRAEDPPRFPAVLLQLHAGAAAEVSIRRARGGLLRRDPEHRFGDVRRIEHGQRRPGFAARDAEPRSRHSIAVTLPPLAVVVFREARVT